MSKSDRPGGFSLEDALPPWADEDRESRKTPFTEVELDGLVEGTIAGIDDTEAWCRLVTDHGEAEARRRLRSALILQDENARRAPRH